MGVYNLNDFKILLVLNYLAPFKFVLLTLIFDYILARFSVLIQIRPQMFILIFSIFGISC